MKDSSFMPNMSNVVLENKNLLSSSITNLLAPEAGATARSNLTGKPALGVPSVQVVINCPATLSSFSSYSRLRTGLQFVSGGTSSSFRSFIKSSSSSPEIAADTLHVSSVGGVVSKSGVLGALYFTEK